MNSQFGPFNPSRYTVRSLGIKNFKSFNKNGSNLEFKPITFLVGPNNTGKSTVLKSLLFLKKGLSNGILSYIRLNDEGTNFGSFRNVVNNESLDPSIDNPNRFLPSTYGQEIEFSLDAYDLRFTFGYREWISDSELAEPSKLVISDSKGDAILHITAIDPHDQEDQHDAIYLVEYSINRLINYLRDRTGENISHYDFDEDDLISFEIFSWGEGEGPYQHVLYESLDYFELTDSMLVNEITRWLEEELVDEFPEELIDVAKNGIDYLINEVFGKNIQESMNRIYHIKPLQSIEKRIILDSSSTKYLFDYHNVLRQQPLQSWEHLDSFIEYWLREFELPGHFNIKRVFDSGFVIELGKRTTKENIGEWTNIADMGEGTKRLVALFFQVATLSARNVILIVEEPELYLHPKFQSKLSDFFVDAHTKFGTQFIIETHSEYLIRKAQLLVGMRTSNISDRSEGATDDRFIIHYFQQTNIHDRNERVKTLRFKSDGTLTAEFGEGFYDEASDLMMRHYKYTRDN